MIVYTSSDTNEIDSRKPGTSMRLASGSRDSGTNRQPRNRAIMTIGTLMRNTDPHQKCSSKNPPVTGPNATAAPDTADHTPMALARSTGSRNTSITMARVAGNTSAAPMPIRPRPMISPLVESWKAAQAEKMPKNTKPICMTRSRP